MKTKFLILGAGPAGLALANRLKQGGESDFLVIEKNTEAGGLCRSKVVDGYPLDIGGGHFLDCKRPHVNRFLFDFMPENEWNVYDRDSRIDLGKVIISHPFEANIWQMPKEMQLEYLKSISEAGCNNGTAMPDKFVDWIYWKLGTRIAEDYMIPYNQKMFGTNLDLLGTYWLDKLPNVSYQETLLSCRDSKPYGSQPGHARFYYPKTYGYGELWLRMADEIHDNVIFGEAVQEIDFNNTSATTVGGGKFEADVIVSTVPWMEYQSFVGAPDEIKIIPHELKSNSIRIDYYPNNMETDAHWIYYPDLNLPYHRILARHNFCPGSNGFWTETNSERVKSISQDYSFVNQYAYPINTIEKPKLMETLLKWSESKNVFGLGRWGEHKHYNSDVTVERALSLAERLRN